MVPAVKGPWIEKEQGVEERLVHDVTTVELSS